MIHLLSTSQLRLFAIACFLSLFNTSYGAGWPCVVPNCPTGCGGGFTSNEDAIARTFLIKKDISFTQHNKRSSAPELMVSIDYLDMMAMVGPGARSIKWETDTGLVINVDVGYATTDTQFWSFPTVDLIHSNSALNIDPIESPYLDSFPSANVVYKSYSEQVNDTTYNHFKLDSIDFLQLGAARYNSGSPLILDWFKTKAFLPVEAGWEIDETLTTIWQPGFITDSLVEHSFLSVDATGMMTPIGEDAVPTVLAFVEYEALSYQDGFVVDSVVYDAFVWFSTEGHRVFGYLEPGAAVEGVTQFSQLIFEKYIKPCGDNLQLGVDPLAGIFKAQDDIISTTEIDHQPIQFVAGSSVLLKAGFSAQGEFEALTDADPCNY